MTMTTRAFPFSNFSSNFSFIIIALEKSTSFLFSSFFLCLLWILSSILKIKTKLSPIWHEGEHTWKKKTRIRKYRFYYNWLIKYLSNTKNYYIITWVGGLLWGQQSSIRTAAIIVQCAWWEQSSLHKRVKSPFTFGLGIEVPSHSLSLSPPYGELPPLYYIY